MKTKKIIWCIQQLDHIGGTEQVSIDLMNSLVSFYQIVLVSTAKIDASNIVYKLDPRIETVSLNVPSEIVRLDQSLASALSSHRYFKYLSYLFRAFYYYFIKRFSLRKKVRKLQSEGSVVISSSLDSYFYAPKKGRVIFHYHFDQNHFLSRGERFCFKIAPKPNQFIFLTKSYYEDIKSKLPKLNATYIYNPVRFSSVKNLDYKGNSLVFVGRFSEQKDPLLALKVAKKLKDDNFPFSLKMFGEGHLKTQMEEYLISNHLEDCVSICPPSKDIKNEFLNADMLLFTSAYEGHPLVLLEARSLSRPVVLNRYNRSVDEICEDNYDSLVVDSRDENEFAKRIEETFSDLEQLKRLKANCYESSLKFSKEEIVESWKKLLG